MTFDSDKAELLRFLEFLQRKEIDMVVYRNLFGALNHAYPEENLAEKFTAQTKVLGTQVRARYAALAAQVRTATDPQTILAVVLAELESRKKEPS